MSAVVEALLVGGGNDDTSINVDIANMEPLAQPRHRARRVNNSRLMFYDPVAREKIALRAATRSAFCAVGVNQFPIFGPGQIKMGATAVKMLFGFAVP